MTSVRENYLRAIDVQDGWVRLQPPPSLAHGFEQLAYHVYVAGPGTKETYCGPIRRVVGEWYDIEGDLSRVHRGQDGMLTRLVVGRDQVLIPSERVIGRGEWRELAEAW